MEILKFLVLQITLAMRHILWFMIIMVISIDEVQENVSSNFPNLQTIFFYTFDW